MNPVSPGEVVARFIDEVRSGRDPERAHRWMAAQVAAHQVQSEHPQTVMRTPAQYAEHVREMWQAYGPFQLTIETLLADGDEVYVRWRQTGWHRPAGQPPRPLVEIASVVYHVADGRIVAYHIQIDRKGIELQIAGEGAVD